MESVNNRYAHAESIWKEELSTPESTQLVKITNKCFCELIQRGSNLPLIAQELQDPSIDVVSALDVARKANRLDVIEILSNDPRNKSLLLKLPPELQNEVFSHLNNNSLIALSRTCKAFRNIFHRYCPDGKKLLFDFSKITHDKYTLDPCSYFVRVIIHSKDISLVSLAIKDPRINPCYNNNLALNEAITWGKVEVVNLLLKDPRISSNYNSNLALKEAIVCGRIEIINLLLEDPRIDLCSNENFALNEAIRSERVEVVNLLLKDPRIDSRGFDCSMIKAAGKIVDSDNRQKIIKLLLEHPKSLANMSSIEALKSDYILKRAGFGLGEIIDIYPIPRSHSNSDYSWDSDSDSDDP